MENDKENINTLAAIMKVSELQKLCRVCLSEAKPSFSLFTGSPTLSDVMWTSFGIALAETKGFPASLCSRCREDLLTASKFKIKALDSEQVLEQYARLAVKSESEYKEVQIKFEPTQTEEEDASRKYKDKSPDEDCENGIEKDIKMESDYFDDYIDNEVSEDNNVDDQDGNVETGTFTNENNRKVKKFVCEVCQKPLSSKYSLQEHKRKMHTGKKKRIGEVSGWGKNRMFHCKECTYSTRHSQSLVYHTRIHTGEKPYKCDICSRCFSQPASLSCHKKTHSDQMYFTCAECGKQFKYKDSYSAHKKVHETAKLFTCNICNKGLKTKKTLENHMNRHFSIKNFSCETCGATFVTLMELLNHAKMHSTEKNFECNMCDFKTSVKKSLKSHLQRHMGNRPYKCSFCEHSCYSKPELTRHIYKHTKEKNYSCPACNTKFTQSSSMNKHMLRTHGIKYNRLDVDRRIVK